MFQVLSTVVLIGWCLNMFNCYRFYEFYGFKCLVRSFLRHFCGVLSVVTFWGRQRIGKVNGVFSEASWPQRRHRKKVNAECRRPADTPDGLLDCWIYPKMLRERCETCEDKKLCIKTDSCHGDWDWRTETLKNGSEFWDTGILNIDLGRLKGAWTFAEGGGRRGSTVGRLEWQKHEETRNLTYLDIATLPSS